MAKNLLKQKKISEDISSKIIRGVYTPGSRLPTYEGLQKHYGVSYTTLHLVIQALKRNGFIVAVSRIGIFVNEFPPHLHSFALVTPLGLRDNRFVRTIKRIAFEQNRVSNVKFKIYSDFEFYVDNQDYQSLLEDVEAKRIGGIFFLNTNAPLPGAIVPFNKIPKVVLSLYGIPGAVKIGMDGTSFVKKSIDRLVAKGRKNIAVIYYGNFSPYYDIFPNELKKRGLPVNKHWFIKIGENVESSAGDVVHLLFNTYPEKRPDGLVIADDNLTERALSAILELNLKVSADLDVVTHCNWPNAVPSILPITRIGYDAGKIIDICINVFRNYYKPGGAKKISSTKSPTLSVLAEDEIS